MANTEHEEKVWHAAVDWVIREHESLSPVELKELIDWLNMDPAHREAYDDASRLWLLTGLVPPSDAPSDDG